MSVLLDDDIWEFVAENNLQLIVDDRGYIVFYYKRAKCYIHHVVVGYPIYRDLHVDHINGNKADNRRENLMLTYACINHGNRRQPSIYWPGVVKNYAYYYTKFQNQKVGQRYNCPTSAHIAYIQAGVKTYGDFFVELTQHHQRKMRNTRFRS